MNNHNPLAKGKQENIFIDHMNICTMAATSFENLAREASSSKKETKSRTATFPFKKVSLKHVLISNGERFTSNPTNELWAASDPEGTKFYLNVKNVNGSPKEIGRDQIAAFLVTERDDKRLVQWKNVQGFLKGTCDITMLVPGHSEWVHLCPPDYQISPLELKEAESYFRSMFEQELDLLDERKRSPRNLEDIFEIPNEESHSHKNETSWPKAPEVKRASEKLYNKRVRLSAGPIISAKELVQDPVENDEDSSGWFVKRPPVRSEPKLSTQRRGLTGPKSSKKSSPPNPVTSKTKNIPPTIKPSPMDSFKQSSMFNFATIDLTGGDDTASSRKREPMRKEVDESPTNNHYSTEEDDGGVEVEDKPDRRFFEEGRSGKPSLHPDNAFANKAGKISHHFASSSSAFSATATEARLKTSASHSITAPYSQHSTSSSSNACSRPKGWPHQHPTARRSMSPIKPLEVVSRNNPVHVDDDDDLDEVQIADNPKVTFKKPSSPPSISGREEANDDGNRVLFTFPEDSHDSVSITVRDVKKCSQDVFLNDSLIDFYLKYVTTTLHRSASLMDRVHVFTSFLYTRMLDSLIKSKGSSSVSMVDYLNDFSNAKAWYAAFKQVRRWTVGIDLFSKSCIIFPINSGLHWSFAACCFTKQVDSDNAPHGMIFTFDSARPSLHDPELVCAVIRMYLNHEFHSRITRGDKLETRKYAQNENASQSDDDDFEPEILDEVTLSLPKEDPLAFVLDASNVTYSPKNMRQLSIKVPQQLDGVNCGIHVLNNARELLKVVQEIFPSGIDTSNELALLKDSIGELFTNLTFSTSEANAMRTQLKEEILALAEQAATAKMEKRAAKAKSASDSPKHASSARREGKLATLPEPVESSSEDEDDQPRLSNPSANPERLLHPMRKNDSLSERHRNTEEEKKPGEDGII